MPLTGCKEINTAKVEINANIARRKINKQARLQNEETSRQQ